MHRVSHVPCSCCFAHDLVPSSSHAWYTSKYCALHISNPKCGWHQPVQPAPCSSQKSSSPRSHSQPKSQGFPNSQGYHSRNVVQVSRNSEQMKLSEVNSSIRVKDCWSDEVVLCGVASCQMCIFWRLRYQRDA